MLGGGEWDQDRPPLPWGGFSSLGGGGAGAAGLTRTQPPAETFCLPDPGPRSGRAARDPLASPRCWPYLEAYLGLGLNLATVNTPRGRVLGTRCTMRRAEEKEKSKRQEGSRESHGTAPPARSSSSAPGASFTIAAKAIGELVSCPPPPQPSRGLWMPDSHDPCTPEGALGVPWVLSAATCAEEGEKRLAPGSVSMGGSGLDPPSPIYGWDKLCLHGFLGCWGVLLPTRCSTRRV